MGFDIQKIRGQFPILKQTVYGKPLVYFDNAATTQKPQRVIDSLVSYYTQYNSNIHRGAHFLADKATSLFEKSRKSIQEFINSPSIEQVIFTYGTTDGINLLAQAYGRTQLKEGDEILISAMEHHANIVPWQLLCKEKSCILKVVPMNECGELLLEEYEKLLTEKTKIVSIVHVSNALGTVNPIKRIINMAHKVGAVTVIDAAQSISHLEIDVQALDVDFMVFSSHKMFGPGGVGVLYGKKNLLELMSPYRAGGEMIRKVSFESTTFADLPFKFEAGTPNIGDVIAFSEAIAFIEETGKANIMEHEHQLLNYATEQLTQINDLEILGTAADKISVISFNVKGIHHSDFGVILDQHGLATRAGNHCTQPIMQFFGITGTVRASFSVYNTIEEVDYFVTSIKKTIKFLR